jgi:hypothetical protein
LGKLILRQLQHFETDRQELKAAIYLQKYVIGDDDEKMEERQCF